MTRRPGRGAALCLALVMLLAHAAPLAEGEPRAVIIVSGGAAAYRQAEKGITDALASAGPGHSVATVLLQEAGGETRARRALAEGPQVVLAVGIRAARLAREAAPRSPLVYALVLDPASAGLPAPGHPSAPHVTGVAMDVTLAQQFQVARALMPHARRVGVLYDPSISGETVRRAAASLKTMGLELVAQPVRSEADVIEAAEVVTPDVDLLWALPDPTVLTPANASALILMSLRSRTPLLAMSEGYVAHGALAAISAHPFEVGRRAGELAAGILSGTPVRSLPPEMPPRLSFFVNLATAERLGITVPRDMITRAEAVYPRP